MRHLTSLTCVFVGFALAAVLFLGLPAAQSDDDERERAEEAAAAAAHRDFVNRVKRALGPATEQNEFRLVVVATEHGLYTESFGELPPEDALVLGAKLHAMGDLAAAQAEVLLELECHEEEHEDDEEEEDDHEDEEDEDEEHEDDDDFEASDEFGER